MWLPRVCLLRHPTLSLPQNSRSGATAPRLEGTRLLVALQATPPRREASGARISTSSATKAREADRSLSKGGAEERCYDDDANAPQRHAAPISSYDPTQRSYHLVSAYDSGDDTQQLTSEHIVGDSCLPAPPVRRHSVSSLVLSSIPIFL